MVAISDCILFKDILNFIVWVFLKLLFAVLLVLMQHSSDWSLIEW